MEQIPHYDPIIHHEIVGQHNEPHDNLQLPPGNFEGEQIVQVAPQQQRNPQPISTAAHLLEMLSNLIRTVRALAASCSCSDDVSIGALSVLSPNDINQSYRNLIELRAQVRSAGITLIQFRNHLLPEHHTCVASFNNADAAFDRALQLLNQDTTL
jgi:hypothetical protein